MVFNIKLSGNKKEGPIIKYTFLDQIPEVEVK